MFHGLCQQAMRQDVGYWLAYVALRPDRAYTLISYPYYAKRTSKGDKTVFQHIDINVMQAVEDGRGLSQIQGSVSLDNETMKNCTTIIPGLHKKNVVKKWLENMKGRGVELADGFIHKITDKHFTQDDKREFKTDWETVPCKAGEVRITDPLLPHGSTGPADGIRRTMLPWYVKIQKDGSSLEILEAGTWEQLASAHRDLTYGPVTPSGHPVKYGLPPWKPPFATRLTLANPISQALIGQLRWDDATVQYYVSAIFNIKHKQDAEAFLKKTIENQHVDVIAKVGSLWEIVKAREKQEYGDKSWFNNNCNLSKQPKPDFLATDAKKADMRSASRRNREGLFEQPIDEGN
jgi:hypothetical protein